MLGTTSSSSRNVSFFSHIPQQADSILTHDFSRDPVYSGWVTDLELAVLSAAAYEDSQLHTVVLPQDRVQNKRLAWWQVLYQHGWRVFHHTVGTEGFHAVAFIQDERKQIVIAFCVKETPELLTLLADWDKICQNASESHGKQACLFICDIQERLERESKPVMKVSLFNRDAYQMSFTGHSLGAWIASIACSVFHYPAVVFDNPGAKFIIATYQKGSAHGGFVDSYKIPLTNYQAMPNFINTLYEQIGQGFQLAPAGDRDEFQEASLEAGYIQGINWFVEAFSPVSGMPYPSQVTQIMRWPHGGAEAGKALAVLLPVPLCNLAPVLWQLWFKRDISYAQWKNRVYQLAGSVPGLVPDLPKFLSDVTDVFAKTYHTIQYDYTQLNDSAPAKGERLFQQRLIYHPLRLIDYPIVDYRLAKFSPHSMNSLFLPDHVRITLKAVLDRKGTQDLPNHMAYLNQVRLAKLRSADIELILIASSSLLTAADVRRKLLQDLPVLRAWLGEAALSQPPLAKVDTLTYGMPVPISHFIPREAPLHELNARFEVSPPLGSPAILALYAPSGCGKTQLAAAYARHAYEARLYSAVIWIAAGDDIHSAYHTFAQTLFKKPLEGLTFEEERQIVSRVLESQYSSVLFVFDNVNNYEDIVPYLNDLPWGAKVHVLLTLRDELFANHYEAMVLNTFSEPEAIEYIRSSLSDKQVSEKEALALSQCVDAHPLLLSYLTAYIKARSLNFETFHTQYQQQRLARSSLSRTEHLPLKQREAILFSLTHLTLENPLARSILEAWTVLGTNEISMQLLKAYFGDTVFEEAFENALQTLVKYLFIALLPDKPKHFSIYQLLQESMLYQLNPMQLTEIRLKWLDLLVNELDKNNYQSYFKLQQETDSPKTYLKQLFVASQKIIKHIILEDIPDKNKTRYADLLSRMGNYCYFMSYYAIEAKDYYQEALTIYKTAYGNIHQDVATALNSLGRVFKDQPDQAKNYFQQALAIRKIVLGDNHPDVAITLHNLGVVFAEQYPYDEAKNYHEQALAIRKAVFGDKHPTVAYTLFGLGVVFAKRDQYDEAKNYYEQALAIYKAVFGDNYLGVADTLHNLGVLFECQYQYKQCTDYFQQELTIRKTVFGDIHPSVATTLNSLGRLFQRQGQYAQATDYFQQALAMRKAIFGNHGGFVAETLNNLGEVFRSQRQYAQAIDYFQQALAIRKLTDRDTCALDKTLTLGKTLNNLGEVFREQRQYAHAQDCYQQLLAIYKADFGDDSLFVPETLNNLGEVFRNQHQYARATAYYQRALAIYKTTWGTSWSEIDTLNGLGLVFRDQGHYAQAIDYFQQALAKCSDRLQVVGTLNNLGEILRDQGQYAQAKPYFQQALAIYKADFGDNHPKVADTLNNLGRMFRDQRQYDDAKNCYQQALGIYKAVFGENHSKVADTLNNLGLTFRKQSQYEHAKECYQQAFAIYKVVFGDQHPNTKECLDDLAVIEQKIVEQNSSSICCLS